MLAIKLNAEGQAEEVQLADEGSQLEQLQSAVGGLVQAIDFTADLTIWVNEEGNFMGCQSTLWQLSYGKSISDLLTLFVEM